MDIIYTTQPVEKESGQIARNPTHFIGVREDDKDVKNVYVQDGYPEIVEAYSQVKTVKVQPLSALKSVKEASKVDTVTQVNNAATPPVAGGKKES